MFPDKTKVVQYLSEKEKADLYSEVSSSTIWAPHSTNYKKTALKEGVTCHLHWVLDDDELTPTINNLNIFPITELFIKNLFPNDDLGRVYWHNLRPNNKIDLHNDKMFNFVKNNRITNRYQVYLDIPENFVLMFDGQITDHKNFENSLVDFSLQKNHYYKNTSNENVYFLVFDILA